MSLRRIGAIAAVAVLSEAMSWRDLEPDALAAALYVTAAVAFFWFAASARWRELPIFLAAFVLAAIVEQVAIYDASPPAYCDPFCSSPMMGIYLAPFALLLLAPLGMFIAQVWRDLRQRP